MKAAILYTQTLKTLLSLISHKRRGLHMKRLLSNLTIKAKLYILSGSLMTFLLISTITSVVKMDQIGNEITAIAEQDIPLTEVVTAVTINQLEQAINFERTLRYGEEMQTNASATSKFKAAKQSFDKHSEEIANEIKQGESLARTAKQFAHNDEAAKEFAHVETLLKKIEKQHETYEQHAHEAMAALTKGDLQHAHKISEIAEHEEEQIDHELEALLIELEKFTAAAALTAEKNEHIAVRLLIILAAIGFVTGTLLAITIIRNLNKGITLAVNTAEAISAGDLSQEVKLLGNDEIGRLLKSLSTMRASLFKIINEVSSSSTQLAAASEEMATVSEQTSKNLHAQQSEVEQAATAVNEMTSTIQEVARNATATSTTAHEAQDTTNDGKQIVSATISSIGSLASGVENSANVIHELEEHSTSIGAVLDVIKNIAEQTNLLALNAAIEAARAGEQGRGFAVVADEVRTLASRTQESTTEIETMIDKLQSGTRQAVEVMELGRKQAFESVDQAKQAGVALEDITNAVSKITDMNTQIAAAAEEQAAVADEINRNIVQINTLGDQNASGANETTTASEEMAHLATHLNGLMQQFKVS